MLQRLINLFKIFFKKEEKIKSNEQFMLDAIEESVRNHPKSWRSSTGHFLYHENGRTKIHFNTCYLAINDNDVKWHKGLVNACFNFLENEMLKDVSEGL